MGIVDGATLVLSAMFATGVPRAYIGARPILALPCRVARHIRLVAAVETDAKVHGLRFRATAVLEGKRDFGVVLVHKRLGIRTSMELDNGDAATWSN
jgi:hypothetical protein